MSSNESDNEYFKDLLNIDIDCLATLKINEFYNNLNKKFNTDEEIQIL